MIRGVPYDHQLEYIESTGSQWIDTGLDFGNSLDFIIEMDTPTLANAGWVHQMDGSGTWLGTETRVSSTSGGTIYYGNFNNNSKYSARSLFDGTTMHHVVFDSKHGFYLDGVLKRSFTVSYVKDSISGVKLPLFTWYDFRAAAYDPNCPASKVMSFKVTVDGVLRADYIPVSVNGVAMMYDRATGTFPKHYGTFVAGPVASTPLMGVHMYPQVYTTADYVQDGLLAGWSGIAQGGTPYVWKDFSGHKYDLTINPNTSHFESNYLDVGSISTAGAYMEGVLIPGVKHMEICCYVSQKTTNALLFYNGVVPSNMILASHSTAGVLTSNTKRHTAYKRTTGYYALSATHDILYADGAKVVDTTFSSDSWSAGSNSLCLFGRLNDTLYGTAGRIYSARAYSRELTPEEVAHNYRIDKLTFDLPDPE